MKILFLGQNPSKSSPDKPFVGTKSHDTLVSWILASGVIGEVSFANVFDDPYIEHFSNHSIFSAAMSPEFSEKVDGYDIIFTCGIVADRAVASYSAANPDFLFDTSVASLPHPSGLNRLLNNKAEVDKAIETMRKTYESKSLEKMEGTTEGPGVSGVRAGIGILHGEGVPDCPVVNSYRNKSRQKD